MHTPTDAHAHLLEGIALERGGSPARALRAYELAEGAAPNPETRAEALRRQADAHRITGDWAAALRAVERSQSLAREHGLARHLAEALNAEGIIRYCRGELPAARDLFERTISATEDPLTQGLAYQNLGSLSADTGDYAAAFRFFLQGYRCFVQAGFARGEVINLNNLASVMVRQEQHASAEPLFTEAMERAHAMGDTTLYGIATMNRAECRVALGRYLEALQDLGQALAQFKTAQDRFHRMTCMRVFGDLFTAQGNREVALRYYHKALATAEDLGVEVQSADLRRKIAGA